MLFCDTDTLLVEFGFAVKVQKEKLNFYLFLFGCVCWSLRPPTPTRPAFEIYKNVAHLIYVTQLQKDLFFISFSCIN